ncbi:NAD-dependent epimerase/dehydratase family protein [Mucilaginibacter sp. UR6-11]|uniref:NAD-dependent epimerase/dehydratase family protein n=1 Tax=Mucilaginibacter sp. UR6-11 TaxID=1435644 RepID=UPI001E58955E|nr:NAD-dependent epimerase/dehydratase family protein [Mucilaginibacter sp. UR6-11]MCC8424567.1 NAD-dependent epimerase/dehydratase family protein [Mucilaginibacter sp. UR6-11]
MTKKAIIVGASGLIGSNLLDILLAQPEYSEVLSISRKKVKSTNTKLTQLIADFDCLEQFTDAVNGDVLFCCLGTTKKQTPNLTEYIKVDHDYPLELARIALKNGVLQYHLVSAIGASSKSSNFYTRVKGDTEKDIKKIGLKSLHIYEPSVLIGRRKKPRLVEQMAVCLMTLIGPLLFGRLKKYRAIRAGDVARAMFKQSLKNKKGVFIYTSDKIKQQA